MIRHFSGGWSIGEITKKVNWLKYSGCKFEKEFKAPAG